MEKIARELLKIARRLEYYSEDIGGKFTLKNFLNQRELEEKTEEMLSSIIFK